MKKILFLLPGLVSLWLLTACGQTGPLYLPESGDEATNSSTTATE